MKAAVAEVRTIVERAWGDGVTGSLETLFEINRSAAEFWSGYCKLPELHAPAEAPKAVPTLQQAAVNLLSRKSAAPQDSVELDSNYLAAHEQFQAATAKINAYNATVKIANAEIAPQNAALPDS